MDAIDRSNKAQEDKYCPITQQPCTYKCNFFSQAKHPTLTRCLTKASCKLNKIVDYYGS